MAYEDTERRAGALRVFWWLLMESYSSWWLRHHRIKEDTMTVQRDRCRVKLRAAGYVRRDWGVIQHGD